MLNVNDHAMMTRLNPVFDLYKDNLCNLRFRLSEMTYSDLRAITVADADNDNHYNNLITLIKSNIEKLGVALKAVYYTYNTTDCKYTVEQINTFAFCLNHLVHEIVVAAFIVAKRHLPILTHADKLVQSHKNYLIGMLKQARVFDPVNFAKYGPDALTTLTAIERNGLQAKTAFCTIAYHQLDLKAMLVNTGIMQSEFLTYMQPILEKPHSSNAISQLIVTSRLVDTFLKRPEEDTFDAKQLLSLIYGLRQWEGGCIAMLLIDDQVLRKQYKTLEGSSLGYLHWRDYIQETDPNFAIPSANIS
ncbi:MAG: hypothetical protein [Bacteriophage sp.]|nr:MAG: hypothetical protein [Bacteriophage sp.]